MAENNLLFLEQLSEGGKRKKRIEKNRKGGNNRKFNDSDLGRLLKDKTIRNMDKDEYVDILLSALPALCREIQNLYNGNDGGGNRDNNRDRDRDRNRDRDGHRNNNNRNNSRRCVFEDKQTAVDLFTNPSFVKRLKSALEEDGGATNVDEIFTFVGDLFNSRNKALQSDEKVVKAYTVMYAEYVGEKKIKKAAKEFKCKKIQILSILLAAQSYESMKHKFITNKFRGTMTEIYKLENLTKKGFLDLIREIFPKRRNMVIGYLLGERKCKLNEENFDVVSEAVLTILEKMDIDDRKDILKRYAKFKEKNPKTGGSRLSELGDDYPRTTKTIERLIDTGYDKESLS